MVNTVYSKKIVRQRSQWNTNKDEIFTFVLFWCEGAGMFLSRVETT